MSTPTPAPIPLPQLPALLTVILGVVGAVLAAVQPLLPQPYGAIAATIVGLLTALGIVRKQSSAIAAHVAAVRAAEAGR